MRLELDDLWPDSASLAGMHFETPEQFARAQALLGERLDLHRWVWEDLLTIAVRKTDVHLFGAAGLVYTEVEIKDDHAPLSAEDNDEYREWRRQTFSRFVEGLRREG